LTVASVVAFPVDVTSPVRFALVMTVPAVRPRAVPVRFVATPETGVPSAGPTSVGPLVRTTEPVPLDPVNEGGFVAEPVPVDVKNCGVVVVLPIKNSVVDGEA
jgi:hypothetical protein